MKSNNRFKGLLAGTLMAAAAVYGSSHREALSVLNEPCADNTDTYAWVSNGAHDKLYLIMNFNPLHEPGQGNQGLRACNGYRHEFHIGKGTSLKDRIVYRVEFKNTLPATKAPTATDGLGGGNELLWQLTGGTETMTVTRVGGSDGQGLDDGKREKQQVHAAIRRIDRFHVVHDIRFHCVAALQRAQPSPDPDEIDRSEIDPGVPQGRLDRKIDPGHRSQHLQQVSHVLVSARNRLGIGRPAWQ